MGVTESSINCQVSFNLNAWITVNHIGTQHTYTDNRFLVVMMVIPLLCMV